MVLQRALENSGDKDPCGLIEIATTLTSIQSNSAEQVINVGDVIVSAANNYCQIRLSPTTMSSEFSGPLCEALKYRAQAMGAQLTPNAGAGLEVVPSPGTAEYIPYIQSQTVARLGNYTEPTLNSIFGNSSICSDQSFLAMRGGTCSTELFVDEAQR